MANPATQQAPRAPTVDVIEVQPDSSFIANLTRGELRSQVEIARQFPRVISMFLSELQAMALLDEDTAASCFYALPSRGDRDENDAIEGPSIRFAEIVQSAWGHMRVEGRVVDELDRFIVSRGTAWDVQKNNIVAYEVRRSIMTSAKGGRQPRRYSTDLIAVTGNAAASIAIRDAILRNVPQPLWRSVWLAAKKVAIGDGVTLAKRRRDMLEYFQKLGVKPERVLAAVYAQTEADVTLEKLAVLKGMATAIKEGQTSVDDAFPELRAGTGPVPMPQRGPDAAPTSPGAPSTAPPATDPAAPTPAAPVPVRTITAIQERFTSANVPFWAIAFSDGLAVITFSTTKLAEVTAAKERGARFVDVKTRKSGAWEHLDDLVEAPAGAQ